MCGRFTQLYTYAELHAYWSFFGKPVSNFEPRYHICPTQKIQVIVPAAKGVALTQMRWGLVPSWWKKPLKELPASFNARAETVAEKPFFRSAFKSKRCIIPASGWYEWQDRKDGKQPWYFTPSKEPVAFIAGLWETWTDPESKEELLSATMVITDHNTFVGQYHDRMPVILTLDDARAWMSGANGLELLKPAPEDALKAWPVSRKVNSSRAPDEPSLIARIKLDDEEA